MASRPIPDGPKAESVRINSFGVWAGDIQFREVTGSINENLILRFFCCLLPSRPLSGFLIFERKQTSSGFWGPRRALPGGDFSAFTFCLD